MHICVLNPGRNILYASGFDAGPVHRISASQSRAGLSDVEACRRLGTRLESACPGVPRMIVMRCPYGGETFRDLAPWGETARAALRAASGQAPLPVSDTMHLAEACETAWPGVPVWLAFETSFFVDLPVRETLYGLDMEFMREHGIRRFGFHGLYHEAACRSWRHRARPADPARARVLSVCLEPKPELAAVAGLRAIMVTGGMTPAEGLPGECSSGDIDPSIVLKLTGERERGTELIDAQLGRESGLSALAGRKVSLGEVLIGTGEDLALARAVFRHRLLLACGAGVAALGGVDGLVLSGRYATAGNALGSWLLGQLAGAVPAARVLEPVVYEEPLDVILARKGLLAIGRTGNTSTVPCCA